MQRRAKGTKRKVSSKDVWKIVNKTLKDAKIETNKILKKRVP